MSDTPENVDPEEEGVEFGDKDDEDAVDDEDPGSPSHGE